MIKKKTDIVSVFFYAIFGNGVCIFRAKIFYHSVYYWGNLCNFANQNSINQFKYYIYEKI